VVEHPLGKGEVVSSILTGSTTESPTNKGFLRTHVKRALQNRAEQNAKRRAKTHQISTKCSPGVLLSDDQRTTAVKALTYAAALCSMLPAHYTPIPQRRHRPDRDAGREAGRRRPLGQDRAQAPHKTWTEGTGAREGRLIVI
jgi:hypothetical protein